MSDITAQEHSSQHATQSQRSFAPDGLLTGALGATVVWIWFFVSDWLNRSPLHIPAMFGSGLMDLVGGGSGETWQPVLLFTIVHFAYWWILATIVLRIVHAARGNPSVLALGTTMFILVQFLFAGIAAIFSNSGMGAFAWPAVWLGNLAGWVAIWWFIWHRHPELRGQFSRMNDDD